MPFSVVLFDLDGTLINTNDLIVRSFQHTFKEMLGLDVPAKEIYRYFGEPLPVTMAKYSAERAEELTQFYRVFNQAHHDALVANFDDVPRMLQAMKDAGVKLGVVTSKMSDMAYRALNVCGVSHFFDTVVGMDHTTKHKPDPDPIYCALDRLGQKPGDHVLMVGDSAFDLKCGRNAGVKTAAVGWTVIDRAELQACSPDHWVETPADLEKLALGA